MLFGQHGFVGVPERQDHRTFNDVVSLAAKELLTPNMTVMRRFSARGEPDGKNTAGEQASLDMFQC